MHFSRVTILYFHFLFYQRVSSSRYLFSQNRTLCNGNFDNILENFFVDFKTVYLQKRIFRHITIVGAPMNYLEQIQPISENYPYIICADANECAYRKRFSRGSLVIMFLDVLSENLFGKNIKVLSTCRTCKMLFISDSIVEMDDVRLIFTLALKHNVPYSRVAHLSQNGIELYRDYVATNCSMEVELVTVWRPGVGLNELSTWIFEPRDMNGCPVTVSSLTFKPKMVIEEKEDGSLTIVGGKEGKLLLALAWKLNFTLNLRYPSVEDQLKYSRKEAILYDVASGISEIGIGRLRPINSLKNEIAFSFPYDEECITWGVPRVINWSNNIIWVEFSWEVWAFVGLVFTIGCIIRYAHRDIVTSKRSENESLGFVTIFLDAVALHLGSSVTYVSSSPGWRFMLIAYLYYAMVITTAYKTSLASILATREGTPTIIDAQGIIDADIDVGGSLYDYNILKDQVNDSKVTSKLLERFFINNNSSETWNRLLFNHDYAFLGRCSAMSYDRQLIIKAHKSVTFNILNGCVLSYPTVMFFQTKSFLRKPVDHAIQRLSEAGILWHWDADKIDTEKLLKRRSTEKYFEKRASHKFMNIFILYFVCISVSLLTFFIELLIPRIDLSKRQNPIN